LVSERTHSENENVAFVDVETSQNPDTPIPHIRTSLTKRLVKVKLSYCKLSVKFAIFRNMGKNPHAAALGRLGGKARLKKLTPEQRREIARKAGLASGKARKRKAKERHKETGLVNLTL
jgi:hypothetical protein